MGLICILYRSGKVNFLQYFHFSAKMVLPFFDKRNKLKSMITIHDHFVNKNMSGVQILVMVVFVHCSSIVPILVHEILK